jgi:hypothetical protein
MQDTTDDNIVNKLIQLIMILTAMGSTLAIGYNMSNSLVKFLPLLIVFITIGSQVLRDKLKEQQDRKHKEDFLKEMINGFNDGIKSQVTHIDSFLIELKKEEVSDHKLKVITRVNKENINVISRLDSYKFLVKKNDVKRSAVQFEDLYSQIDLADSLSKDLDPLCRETMSGLHKYMEEWYEYLDLVRQYYDKIAIEYRTSRPMSKLIHLDFFIVEFIEQYDSWAKESELNRGDIYFTFKKLIEPLRKIKEYPDTDISNYLLRCEAAFKNYNNQKNFFVLRLEDLRETLNNCQLKIGEYLSKMF